MRCDEKNVLRENKYNNQLRQLNNSNKCVKQSNRLIKFFHKGKYCYDIVENVKCYILKENNLVHIDT